MAVLVDQLHDAVSLQRCGRLREAEAMYRDLLESEPEHADALNLLGVICAQTDRTGEARTLLERAARVAPANAAAQFNLGNVLRDLDQPRTALKHYRAALAAHPKHTGAHLNMAAVLVALGRTRDAVASYIAILAIDPNHEAARRSLAEVLIERNEAHDRLPQILADVTSRDPDSPIVHHDAGDLLRECGAIEAAIVEYRCAIEIDPQYVPGLCNLAGLLAESGKSSEAIEIASRATSLDPNSVEAWINLAAAHLDRRELAPAIDAAKKAIALAPDSIPAHAHLAAGMKQSGRADEAADLLRGLAGRHPESVECWTRLGHFLREIGRPADARDAYRRAIEIRADHPEAHAALLRLEAVDPTRPIAETAARAEEMIQAMPYAIVHASAAEVFAKAKNDERVVELLTPLADCERFSARERRSMALRLGEAHDRLGHIDEAFAWFTRGNDMLERTYNHSATARAFEEIRNEFRAERIASLARHGDRESSLIFIGGLPRSGTTLVEQIIDSHPRAAGRGEMSIATRIAGAMPRLCGDEQPYPTCMVSASPDAIATAAASVCEWLGSAGASELRIVEKSPTNAIHFGLLASLFPSARFILTQRDPRDAGLSCFTYDFTGHYPWTYDLTDIGRYAKLHESHVRQWNSALGDRLTVVTYETLVENFEAEANRIIAFCGLEWDDACLAFHENQRTVLTASRDQVRQPIYRSSVGRWRKYERHLGPLLRALEEG